MKKHYLLDSELSHHKEFSLAAAMILAADCHHPFEYIEEIEETLRKKNIQGNIIIDMLLSNGSGKNRFFSVEFDGNKFGNDHKILCEPSEAIIYSRRSAKIFKEKYKEINTSLLSHAMQFAVKRGLAIK